MNQTIRARRLAKQLFKEWSLDEWEFNIYSHNTDYLMQGTCQDSWAYTFPKKKVIRIRREYVQYAPWKYVEDSIRHEIAHALSPVKPWHGAKWAAMCLMVGAIPAEGGNLIPDAVNIVRSKIPCSKWWPGLIG